MKIVTIIGARPQFIKAASLSRETLKQEGVEEIIVHTGQHFDENMSKIFFDEMQIPKPHYNLAINNLGHGAMTGRMMEEIEKVLLTEKPDWLLVYGDTNSTLAGALAAKKLHIKVAHVEAGLRSFNMKMPEEVNRILTDRISDVLFCPTQQAIDNLEKEGYKNIDCKVVNVGDIMYDSAMFFSTLSKENDKSTPNNYVLATVHRAENTDDFEKLKNIFKALDSIHKEFPVVLPLHPRTKKLLEVHGVSTKIHLIEPVGYLEMVSLIKNSKAVITDSGGLQKEAYFFKKQGFTLRDQTEWVELITAGCNQLIDVLNDDISEIVLKDIEKQLDFSKEIYGDGNTSEKILDVLKTF
ncbi:MAG: UDP-N-acetylglucosamine 2-epimerase (non-hydrolyzing) [Flavobacterium sp.]|nr:MAG: UDP-N-acetylglucosamine 2-epimerase (non-hydrolyzing) [Flavobacterium sp.]